MNELKIKEIYRQAVTNLRDNKIETPELDARILIRYVLNLSDADFILKQNGIIDKKSGDKIERLISRRAKGEPVAYIVGHKEFYGRDFFVDKNVLIPRPETEWLVEKSIKYLEESIKDKTVIDVGTGSGNIIVALAKSLPRHRYFATDISNKALEIAKKNARCHGVKENIEFYRSNLFKGLKNKSFDLIIANLPYVPKIGINRDKLIKDIDFEPTDAIFADDHGTSVIKKFLIEARDHLNNKGLILLELDPRNANNIKSFAEKNYPGFKIELKKDLANLDRYLIIL